MVLLWKHILEPLFLDEMQQRSPVDLLSLKEQAMGHPCQFSPFWYSDKPQIASIGKDKPTVGLEIEFFPPRILPKKVWQYPPPEWTHTEFCLYYNHFMMKELYALTRELSFRHISQSLSAFRLQPKLHPFTFWIK